MGTLQCSPRLPITRFRGSFQPGGRKRKRGGRGCVVCVHISWLLGRSNNSLTYHLSDHEGMFEVVKRNVIV